MKALVTVILGIFLSQTNAYSVHETCAIVQSGTFIADPKDCQGYYYCENGVASDHGSCGPDYVYNTFAGTCDFPENYNCPFNGQVCQGNYLVFLPDPLDCSSYIYCDAKGNAAYGSCGNQIYNEELNRCVHPQSTNTCSGEKCSLVPNNHFVAGNDPYTSFTCYNGRGAENNCNENGGKDFVYNSLKGECEAAPAEPEDANALCADIQEEDQFAASTIDCNAYYYCSPDAPRIPTKLFCPQRFHFDEDSQMCDYSWNIRATNGCNRCGGYPAGSYVGATRNCQTYALCNGKIDIPAKTANCPSTYPFFNEERQMCTKTDPSEEYCS